MKGIFGDFNRLQWELVRGLFQLLADVYRLLLSLAENNLLEEVSKFSKSIYLFAGIFMFFRIGVSLLNYLINPDSFSDKSAGAGKLLSRVVVSVLLVITGNSLIFPFLTSLQSAIVSSKDGIIFRILNIESSAGFITDEEEGCAVSLGSKLAANTVSPFIDGKFMIKDEEADLYKYLEAAFMTGSDCSTNESRTIARARLNDSFEAAGGNTGSEVLGISISFIPAFIAFIGIFIFVVIMCVDIVVRNLKLLLLEMIAPVAFLSYISPKDKVFDQWLKSFGSVYVDLFLKLLAISLTVQLFAIVYSSGAAVAGIVKIFYLLGILVFAKAVPDFISKIFGIDGAGSFKDSANMLKKGLGFAAGATAAVIGAGFAAHKIGAADKEARKNRSQEIKRKLEDPNLSDAERKKLKRQERLNSSAAGRALSVGRYAKMGLSGALKGGSSGWSGKGMSAGFNDMIAEGDRMATAVEGGSTFTQRAFAGFNKTFGTDIGGLKKTKLQKEALDELDKKDSEFKSKVKDEMYKKNTAGIAESQMRLEAMEQANKDGDYRRVLIEAGIDVKRKGSNKNVIDGVEYDDAALAALAREKLAGYRTSHAEREKATIQAVIDGHYIGEDGKMHTVDIIESTPELQKLSQELEETSAKAVTAGAIDADRAVVRRSIEVKTGVDAAGNDITELVQTLSFGEPRMDTIVDIKHGSKSASGKEYYGARAMGSDEAYEFDHEVIDEAGNVVTDEAGHVVRAINKSGFKAYTDDIVSRSEARAKELQDGAAAAQEFANSGGKK